MKSQEDTDPTSWSLSPAEVVWENLNSYENLSTTCCRELHPTLVYLHWRRTLQQQHWESCRWHHLDDYIWKRIHLSMTLDRTGNQQWDQGVTTFSTTGVQPRQTSYFQESGTWQRLATVSTSSSTTYQSSFLLRKTEMSGRLLMRL